MLYIQVLREHETAMETASMGKYTHLSISDRRRLYTLLDMGWDFLNQKKLEGYPSSSIYRELKRNTEPNGYFPK